MLVDGLKFKLLWLVLVDSFWNLLRLVLLDNGKRNLLSKFNRLCNGGNLKLLFLGIGVLEVMKIFLKIKLRVFWLVDSFLCLFRGGFLKVGLR